MPTHEPAPEVSPLRRRRRGFTGWLVLAAVLLVVLVLAWFGREKFGFSGAGPAASAAAARGGRRFGGASRVQPVSVQAVRRRDLHVVVNAIGTLTAANTATVRPQVSGVLQTLNFKEGQTVRAGQQLAQIDPRAFQAALAQAEGTLARDKAQLDNARVDLRRYQDLLAQDAVARQTLDTQQALVHQLEGTARSDQANVDAARLQLSYTRVLAPISGRAGLKQADLGNVVGPSDTDGIVVIAQTRPMALVFAVPAIHLAQITSRLRSGETLQVEAWDRDDKARLATGRVASLDNTIDISTDSVRLKAEFANTDDALFPNQSVSVRLRINTVEQALVVPPAALLRGTQGFYVYVVGDDNKVVARNVTPGTTDDNWTGVSGALKLGERVVIDGVDRLRDGAQVEVIAADPSQRKGASAPAGGRPQLSPETRARLRTMSADERQAFMAKLRAAHVASGAAAGTAPPAAAASEGRRGHATSSSRSASSASSAAPAGTR